MNKFGDVKSLRLGGFHHLGELSKSRLHVIDMAAGACRDFLQTPVDTYLVRNKNN